MGIKIDSPHRAEMRIQCEKSCKVPATEEGSINASCCYEVTEVFEIGVR